MRLFAIADLHLPGGQDKPMDVFGSQWDGHFEKIAADWRERVSEEDLVLLPGDLSWALSFEDALPDLSAVFALPGKKALLRGNHDYWWPSVSRLRAAVPENVFVLQNDALDFPDFVVAGSRGWVIPRPGSKGGQDEKLYKRELVRLELSLKHARAVAPDKPLLAMLHYPPTQEEGRESGFTELLEAYGARACFYGHLHGASLKEAFNGEMGGVLYRNVSSDGLGFKLYEADLSTLLALPEAGAEA